MPWAIETYSLTKYFPVPHAWLGYLSSKHGARPAVDRVDLSVGEGELFGLLGPNGAGKTTLIKLLSTLIIPTSGSAMVNGHELRDEAAVKASVGLVTSDERSFFWRLSGRRNLEFFATLHGLTGHLFEERVGQALELVGLTPVGGNRFQTYSTGMRQRLSIARALLVRPRVLFLDEPTKGLDPTATRQLHRVVRDQLISQHGMTVFITTHDLDEATQLCDRIAVMQHGRIQGCGSIDELRDSLGLIERYHLVVRSQNGDLAQALVGSTLELEATPLGDPISSAQEFKVSFKADDENGSLGRVIDRLRQQGGEIRKLSREAVSLEAIFEQLTNGGTGKQPENHPGNSPARPLPNRTHHAPRFPSFSLQHFLSVVRAFIKRDFQEEVSYRVSFFLQFFGIFFSVAVFYFIARMLGPSAAPYLSAYGGDYFSFVLIGIAFSGYFGVGLSGFASSLRKAQTTGTLEAMLSTPTGISTIILSSSIWSYLETTFRVGVYLAMGALLLGVDLGQGDYVAALLVLILTIISFSSLGIIAASFIMVLKRGDPVTWIFSSLSSLLGGVYYPIAVLPGWMQWPAKFLPITYSLEAMRRALLQGASIGELAPELTVLALFCLILLPLSLVSFKYAVRQARIDGSLTHY